MLTKYSIGLTMKYKSFNKQDNLEGSGAGGEGARGTALNELIKAANERKREEKLRKLRENKNISDVKTETE